MGFGFRVGVPGMSVRVSTRGVRTSIGCGFATGTRQDRNALIAFCRLTLMHECRYNQWHY